jgi:DNA-binding transcriptional regulator YhcF (GntR family)
VSAGALRRGDRLASAREVAAEFDADPRLVLAAYRILSGEGVVEIRRRSGIYVAATPEVSGGPAVVAEGWLVEVLAQGLEHGVSAPRMGEWLRRCVTTRRLRAAVVAGTSDQLEAFCGELRDDYGCDAVPFAPDVVEHPGGLPSEMLAVDFVLAEEAFVPALRAALAATGRRVIPVSQRAEVDATWSRLLEQHGAHFVVSDPRSVAMLGGLLRAHAERVVVHVVGQDDLRQIPAGAPVYVTRAARRRLGTAPVPGRPIPPARAFTGATMRAVLGVVVEENLRAMSR